MDAIRTSAQRQPGFKLNNNRGGSESGVSAPDDETWQHEVPQGLNCGCMFPWLLIEGIVHLSIYIYKLVDDSRSVREYWDKRQRYGLLISVLCLILPTFIYAMYEMLRTVLSEQSSPRNVLTKLVKGILLIPWQIKGHCEMLAFSADKVCQWRRLDTQEQEEISKIKQDTFVLEFFEDFYSGFVQLLLQLHFISAMAANNNSDYVIYSEIVGSSLAVFSLIKALQRRDDGCLTKTLSYIGWMAYCASRVLSFGLLSSVLGGVSVLVVILLHAVMTTAVVFQIIKDTHREAEEQTKRDSRASNVPLQKSNSVLLVLTFFLFGLPSLIYWPMMFTFKKKLFVFCFLTVGVLENFLCVVAWFLWKEPTVQHNISNKLVLGILSLTAIGVLSLVLYIFLKPQETDRVVLSHIVETNSNKYGIFFDFCKAVHVLPNVEDIDHRRHQLQRLRPELLG
ncbi:hypothetical protein BIW11_01947 [Tropilaelaps mercedesae]|uniref:XK-related protein n=1 Tax=Tropilaelaps mercedesae TaxID=418985 RepID=A0A1V9X640_9ACAR|nr:hypothetical protein BIW11_01947 [Tropilaelaps mercedesae]